MNIVYIILIVIVALFLIFLFFDVTLNKLKSYFMKITLVEEKINTLLDNKYNNIIKINDIIREKIGTEKEIIDDITSLKDDSKSKTEIDNGLNDAFEKVEYIKDQYDELDNEEELNNLFNEINQSNESLNAYKKYYNDNVINYNKQISKFPYGITSALFKYKAKELFDEEKEKEITS